MKVAKRRYPRRAALSRIRRITAEWVAPFSAGHQARRLARFLHKYKPSV